MKEKDFCRCCLAVVACKNMYNEYYDDKRKETYAEMLLNTFNINVLKPSYNTCSICETCVGKLNNATSFRSLVLKSQQTILKGWDILKNNAEYKIELDDVDYLDYEGDHFSDDDFRWDDEPCNNTGHMLFIKLEPIPDQVPNETDLQIPKSKIRKKMPTRTSISSYKEKVLHTIVAKKSDEKSMVRKGVTTATKASIRNVTSVKKITKAVKGNPNKETRTLDQPITQPEIDSRENTCKLILNSNLCLFRSLKTKYGCFMCKESFVDPTDLREHSITHMNTTFLAYRVRKWRGLSYKNVDISDLKCKECLQQLNSLHELMNHLEDKHNILFHGESHLLIPYRLAGENQCVLCELKFNTFLRLSIHMNSHYANNVCEICGSSFINRMSLRMHVQSQHKEKKCSFCPAVFLTVSSKAKHLKKVHKVFNMKRYCNLCDRTFPYTYILNKHKIEEHGAKKTVVNCNECGKTFFHEANLRVHTRSVHIKERNYPCEVCGTRFFTRCDQRRHEKTHNDVRSFACSYCDAKFKSKDSWRRHMKRQHGHVFP